MLVSYTEYYTNNQKILKMFEFDDSTFFYLCLPPIVFASGFNMRRGNFFANIKNILLFGILGTFVCFFSFSAMTIWITKHFDIKQYQYDEKRENILESNLTLTSPECMLMCSLLCSSDVVAAVSLISYD